MDSSPLLPNYKGSNNSFPTGTTVIKEKTPGSVFIAFAWNVFEEKFWLLKSFETVWCLKIDLNEICRYQNETA